MPSLVLSAVLLFLVAAICTAIPQRPAEHQAVSKQFHQCCEGNGVTGVLLDEWCTFDYLDTGKNERIPYSGSWQEAVGYNKCLFINGTNVRECCAEKGIAPSDPCSQTLCTPDFYVTQMSRRMADEEENDWDRHVSSAENECENEGSLSADASGPSGGFGAAAPKLSKKGRHARRIAFGCWRDAHAMGLGTQGPHVTHDAVGDEQQ